MDSFGESLFQVKWGLEEPDRRFYNDWDYEVAIAKQLGYNEQCMAAHKERYDKFFYGVI